MRIILKVSATAMALPLLVGCGVLDEYHAHEAASQKAAYEAGVYRMLDDYNLAGRADLSLDTYTMYVHTDANGVRLDKPLKCDAPSAMMKPLECEDDTVFEPKSFEERRK